MRTELEIFYRERQENGPSVFTEIFYDNRKPLNKRSSPISRNMGKSMVLGLRDFESRASMN